ncbi:unnamed protein product, partial [Effrenium voratum]
MVSGPSFSPHVKALLDLQAAGDAALAGDGDAATAAEQYAAALARLKEVGHEIQSFDVRAFKATLLSNRAQALLKLERYEEALADAQASLQIQPDNAKAQFRRSMAQSGLEQAQRRRSQGEALKQALFCKTAGNKLLTEGQLEGAIAKYSDGLEWLEDAAGDSACRDVRLALRANRCQGLLRRRRWPLDRFQSPKPPLCPASCCEFWGRCPGCWEKWLIVG